MGCKINYWDCEFKNLDVDIDNDGSEVYYYYCSHPKTGGYCNLENKYDDRKVYCKFAKKGLKQYKPGENLVKYLKDKGIIS